MMTFDETTRFIRIQERLRNATYHELRKDGHHKSSEGALSIAFCLPPVVGDKEGPSWVVEAYSYLLCPDGRSGSWSGKTAAEAIAKAEDAMDKWCFASEMEQFSGEYETDDEPKEGEAKTEDGPTLPF